jgi:hypothetical protein
MNNNIFIDETFTLSVSNRWYKSFKLDVWLCAEAFKQILHTSTLSNKINITAAFKSPRKKGWKQLVMNDNTVIINNMTFHLCSTERNFIEKIFGKKEKVKFWIKITPSYIN